MKCFWLAFVAITGIIDVLQDRLIEWSSVKIMQWAVLVQSECQTSGPFVLNFVILNQIDQQVSVCLVTCAHWWASAMHWCTAMFSSWMELVLQRTSEMHRAPSSPISLNYKVSQQGYTETENKSSFFLNEQQQPTKSFLQVEHFNVGHSIVLALVDVLQDWSIGWSCCDEVTLPHTLLRLSQCGSTKRGNNRTKQRNKTWVNLCR